MFQTIDARGNTTELAYDLAGRRTKITNALLQETSFAYDAAGNQSSMTDANGNSTQFFYDGLNRRTEVRYADGTSDFTGYDALGRQTSKTDQAGKVTQFVYDALGRLTEVIDALSQSTFYGYDEVGNRVSQTDANNHTTAFEYDRLGRRMKRTLPLGMSETFTYDAAGNMKTKKDFNGRTTSYEYDALNRLLQKTPDPFFAAPPIIFTYWPSGQRQSMTDPSGVTTYAYDERDRLTQKATPQGTLSYTYDEAGNVTSIQSSNVGGASMAYAYDELNRLATVTDASGVTTYSYDDVGNLEGYTYPNGVGTSYLYDELNRLTNVTSASATSTLASYTYSLDPAGHRTSVEELSGRVINYAYDALYRIEREEILNSPNSVNTGAADYVYDAVGNRLSRASSIGAIPSQSTTYDANDRVASATFDPAGNTLTFAGYTYAYDFENRLVSVDGDEIQYIYNGDGDRVSQTIGDEVTGFLMDRLNPTGYAQVIDELVLSITERQHTYGLDLVAQHRSSGTNYYLYDGLGSVRTLVGLSPTATDTYDYDAFGEALAISGATPNRYRFTGERLGVAPGLYHLRARDLAIQAGRFITRDSYEGHPFDPITLHPYLYARGNPSNHVDPSGNLTLPEISLTTAIQGLIRGVRITSAARALGNAKDRIALGIGVLETSYALLNPTRTNVGIEWTFKFRDSFDRRVHPSVTIACGRAASPTRVCDTLGVKIRPRATSAQLASFTWDFATGGFSFDRSVNLSLPFTLVETKFGRLVLEGSLRVASPLERSQLLLAFKILPPVIGGLPRNTRFVSQFGATGAISTVILPDDLVRLLEAIGAASDE